MPGCIRGGVDCDTGADRGGDREDACIGQGRCERRTCHDPHGFALVDRWRTDDPAAIGGAGADRLRDVGMIP